MDPDLKESIDFDFFDERPAGKNENVAPSSSSVSTSKPPVHPHSTRPLSKQDGIVNSNDSKFVDRNRSESSSDSSRDSSPDVSVEFSAKSQNSTHSLSGLKREDEESESTCSSSSSISSMRSNFISSSSLSDLYPDNHQKLKNSVKKGNQLRSSNGSVNIHRLAKHTEQAFQQRSKNQQEKAEYNSRAHSDSYVNKAKKSATFCGDNGDSVRASENMDKRQAWEEVNVIKEKKKRQKSIKDSKTFNIDRPQTAVKRRTKITTRNVPTGSHSDSGTLSDSDITDVSSIDTPRYGAQGKYKDKRVESSKVTSAGDHHPVKIQFKSVTDVDQKGADAIDHDYDPDKITGLDLQILMKAVGELEQQKRVQTNSHRVMFAPSELKSIEKGNYTFDRNQTRNIERENHRLLKEIVRHVNSGEQGKQMYRPPNLYRLTPSAVNRERDIQRIERENLAFLKRLQVVKPTKSICRDQQLRSYESTIFHGVPIAALHDKPKARRIHSHAQDGSDISTGAHTRSASSIASIGSSVRSVGSSRSSRPSSASRKSVSSTKHFDSRPAWSDRW